MVWDGAREDWEAARPYLTDALALILLALLLAAVTIVFIAITP